MALAGDGKILYVAQSPGPAPVIMAYPLKADGSTDGGKLFFDCKDLKGPGGCLILDPQGKLLGRIHCGRSTANIAIGEGGNRLYLTSDDRLLRVALLR